ncbi:MAG: hypothetical protein AAF614_11445 [Chloroflexota bacterium]
MSEILQFTLVALLSAPVLIALLVTLTFLLPQRTAQTQTAVQTVPRRAFIIGLVNTLFFGVLAALFGQAGEAAGVLAMLIILSLLAFAFVGLGGVLVLLQERIYPPFADHGLSVLQMRLRTAVLLIAALLAPIVGWFILAPLLLITCLGAAIQVIVRRRKQKDVGD